METPQRIRDFIIENFYVSDTEELSSETHLIMSGIVDSTGMLEVIGFIEREFGFRVEDRETIPENLASIGQICAFIDRKQLARAARAS